MISNKIQKNKGILQCKSGLAGFLGIQLESDVRNVWFSNEARRRSWRKKKDWCRKKNVFEHEAKPLCLAIGDWRVVGSSFRGLAGFFSTKCHISHFNLLSTYFFVTTFDTLRDVENQAVNTKITAQNEIQYNFYVRLVFRAAPA